MVEVRYFMFLQSTSLSGLHQDLSLNLLLHAVFVQNTGLQPHQLDVTYKMYTDDL